LRQKYELEKDLNDKINYHAVASCWINDEWDVVTANQSGRYYDLWALRTFDDWCDHDALDNPPNQKISCEFKNIPIESGLIPVKSCFGGTGIYKFKHTLDCKYNSYKQNHIDERCEHVSFHEDMILKHNAKLFINPKMINS
jgi:hypothetical protein